MSDDETMPASRPPTAGRTLVSTVLPWNADSVSEARDHMRAAAAELGLAARTARSSVLAVSELVSNAVKHGTPPLQLRLLALPRGVRVEVDDASPTPPQVLAVPTTAANGRGLTIVGAVSEAWGHYSTGSGKCVWCDIESSA